MQLKSFLITLHLLGISATAIPGPAPAILQAQPQFPEYNIQAPIHAPLAPPAPRSLASSLINNNSTTNTTTANSATALQCLYVGPQCLTYPPNGSPEETFSVRVFCMLTADHEGKPEIKPRVMYPCPQGSRCTIQVGSQNGTGNNGEGVQARVDSGDDYRSPFVLGEEEDGEFAWTKRGLVDDGVADLFFNFSCVVDDA